MRFDWTLDFLLQAGEAAPAGNPAAPPSFLDGIGGMLPLMAIIFVIFWILVFRPEGKKRKDRELMIKNVKKGDTVVTTGGIIAEVFRVDAGEVVLVLDPDKNVKARFSKSCLYEVLNAKSSGSEKGTSEKSTDKKKAGDELTTRVEEGTRP